MRITYFIFKLRGSQQSSYGIYHAQTNIQTNYNLSTLYCLSCAISFNVHPIKFVWPHTR